MGVGRIFNKAYSLTSTIKILGVPRMVGKDELLWFFDNILLKWSKTVALLV